MSVETGDITAPSGATLTDGFKITIDDGLPPAKENYIRERVYEILGKLPENYKITQSSNTNIIIQTEGLA